jgi:hypothetical protein
MRLVAVAVLVLAVLPWYFPAPGSTGASPSLAVRWLGPFARSAATVQWVRVDAAIRDGRSDLALARAQTAIALDPTATGGWMLIASHLVHERASPERELDPARRLVWLRAGLDLARRAEATVPEPAEMAEWQGVVLQERATSDPKLPWPGGLAAMWREAAACFERAAELGSEHGAELARLARSIADELDRP